MAVTVTALACGFSICSTSFLYTMFAILYCTGKKHFPNVRDISDYGKKDLPFFTFIFTGFACLAMPQFHFRYQLNHNLLSYIFLQTGTIFLVVMSTLSKAQYRVAHNLSAFIGILALEIGGFLDCIALYQVGHIQDWISICQLSILTISAVAFIPLGVLRVLYGPESGGIWEWIGVLTLVLSFTPNSYTAFIM